MQTYDPIVRGASAAWTVELTDSAGWDEGAASWSWSLRIASKTDRGTLAANVPASSVGLSEDGKRLTMTFVLSSADAGDLAVGAYYVECVADDGDEVHAYPAVHGTVQVREMEGGAPQV
jgi:hypothetical protein